METNATTDDGGGNSGGNSLKADIQKLSVEEFEFILNQLTDHNLPESKKCPLVQRLNAEDLARVNNNSTTASSTTTTSAYNSSLQSPILHSQNQHPHHYHQQSSIDHHNIHIQWE